MGPWTQAPLSRLGKLVGEVSGHDESPCRPVLQDVKVLQVVKEPSTPMWGFLKYH